MYMSIKDLEEITDLRVDSVQYHNSWIVCTLKNGAIVRFRDWKS